MTSQPRPPEASTSAPDDAAPGLTPPSRTVATKASIALLSAVGAFQVALAAGAPWGAAAWGGAHPGVLPSELRGSSAVSALVYLGLALVTGSGGNGMVSPTVRRRTLTVAAGFMVVGTVANLASPSVVEKAVWSPVAAALMVLLWRARRDLDPVAAQPE